MTEIWAGGRMVWSGHVAPAPIAVGHELEVRIEGDTWVVWRIDAIRWVQHPITGEWLAKLQATEIPQ